MSDREIYTKERYSSALEGGVELQFTLDWEDAVTASSTDFKVYLKSTGADITDDVDSGAHTESGNVSTYKTITTQANHGGDKYICILKATVGGLADQRKHIINIDEADKE
jgi:hypothetical protein